jgi:predicted N-acetyltransferase YhbS
MIPEPTATPALVLRSEQAADAAAIEALLDRAFGPGRFVKASERVRELAEFRPDLSMCALEAGRLVGSVRMWRVQVGETPAIFLGPLAVETDARSAGVGGLLVEAACRAAEAAGFPIVVLVGDAPYFGRFGFSADHTRGVRLPGPVDPRRLLARGAATPLAGQVGAATRM